MFRKPRPSGMGEEKHKNHMKVILKGSVPVTVDDFPPGTVRTVGGALHLRPGSLVEVTQSEYEHLNGRGLNLEIHTTDIGISEVSEAKEVKLPGPESLNQYEKLLELSVAAIRDEVLTRKADMNELEYRGFITSLIPEEIKGKNRNSLIRFLTEEK